MSKRPKFNINGPFVSHALEMRRSPAWLYLSDTARRVLDRLEVEHMEHGGAESGSLICTYKDFEKVGIRRASMRPSRMRFPWLSGSHPKGRPSHFGHPLVAKTGIESGNVTLIL